LRIYGWLAVMLILTTVLSFFLYVFYGKTDREYIVIEKTPVLTIKQSFNTKSIIDSFSSVKNISAFSFGMIDYKIFIGKYRYDLKEQILYLEPLNKDLYDELKNLAVSIEKESFEEVKKIKYFDTVINGYTLSSKNFYIRYIPRVFLIDFSKIPPSNMTYIRTRYFIFDKSMYKKGGFQKSFVEGLKNSGGVVLDSRLLGTDEIDVTLSLLKNNGITVSSDLKLISFKGE